MTEKKIPARVQEIIKLIHHITLGIGAEINNDVSTKNYVQVIEMWGTGAKKKVAPTSGLINIQNFWCVCLQIAEQIIDRTGNAPGVYLSGALKGGMEKLDEVKKALRERGY